MLVVLQSYRVFYLLIEQPKNTFMYKVPEMMDLILARGMVRYLTYMGYFVPRYDWLILVVWHLGSFGMVGEI